MQLLLLIIIIFIGYILQLKGYIRFMKPDARERGFYKPDISRECIGYNQYMSHVTKYTLSVQCVIH